MACLVLVEEGEIMEEKRKLRWWEDKVDEMFIALIVGVITSLAIWKGGDAGMTVAGTAIGGLCVYVSNKVKPDNK